MSEGVTIDLGSSLPYLVDSVLGWFDHDAESVEWKRKIEHLVKLSAAQASQIQCVGMAAPAPITKIYQSTRLLVSQKKELVDVKHLLQENSDLLIFAGPGWGKTTFLHWLYVQLAVQASPIVPMLFTLRRPKAAQELEEFVGELERKRKKGLPKRHKLLLLVDGYDEISEEDRQLVSKTLTLFRSLGTGNVYLTCRSFYHVYDFTAVHCEIAPFTQKDSIGFITAFCSFYGAEVNPSALLKELIDHGFSDFATHPLMLTLCCILKSSANPEIPRRSIGLIRRAIDILTLRWDEQRGIHRTTEIPLDGEERVRCLMRIANGMTQLEASERAVQSLAQDHLRLLQVKGIDVRKLLDELARWYGLLVPLQNDRWTFVHKTIHDYLAARFWVESGSFATMTIREREWTTRAAYATSLTSDATNNLVRMLIDDDAFPIFTECLYNQAVFNAEEVALAVLKRSDRRKETVGSLKKTPTHISAATEEDFYSLASDDFLREIAVLGIRRGSQGSQIAALYAMAELDQRSQKLSSTHVIEALNNMYAGSLASNGFPVSVHRKGGDYSFKLNRVVTPNPK